MRCPICDQDIDSLRVHPETEPECCPLCRALVLEGAEGICGTDLASLDASHAAETSGTPVARRSIEDVFNWY
jgi:hypothetical protein